jgi:hypothetical protein
VEKIAVGAADAFESARKQQAFLDQLRDHPEGIPAPDALRTLSKLSRDITAGLVRAFEYPIPDIERPTRVSWQYLGLALAIAELAADADTPAFVTKVETGSGAGKIARVFV